ncbi:FG-GAP-like repeat-containing protein, partial [Chitinimonas sp. PSY-7]|uniref:FG-GAP-like repeat-containing protein n=1 Tax=Chitinimonas sp. PSY-7 TaxID=3459088 RepID=UPI00403FCF34
MVAIVLGNQLGLSAGASAVSSGNAALGQSQTGIYVNAATGNLAIQDRDEFLAAKGFKLGLLRTYNSQAGLDGDNNDNWSIGVYKQVRLESGAVGEAGSTLLRVREDGSEVRYQYDAATKTYRSQDQGVEGGTIRHADNQWRWTSQDGGLTEQYSATDGGRLTQLADRDGNALTYHYAANGLISRIDNVGGEALVFHYQGRLLTDIQHVLPDGKTQTRTRYQYDAQGRLSQLIVDLTPDDNSVADGKAYVTRYEYAGASHRISKLTQGDGTCMQFDYVESSPGEWQLSQITDGEGKVTTLQHNAPGVRDQFSTAQVKTALLTGGNHTVVPADTWASLAEKLYGNAKAADALRLAFKPQDLVSGSTLKMPPSLVYAAVVGQGGQTTVTDPLGNKTAYQYDGAGRVTAMGKSVSAANGQWTRVEQVRYEYDPAGNLCRMVDAQGNVTTYSYDAAGNLIEQRDPNGLRVTRRYSADNQLIAESRYQYRAVDGVAFDSTVASISTRWIYENQHLRFAVDASGRVTEYRYDAAGQRTAELVYLQNTYDVAALAEGVDPTLAQMVAWQAKQEAASAKRTDYSYDFRGQLETETRYVVSGAGKAEPLTTRYVYDAMGRLLSKVDPLAHQTSFAYDGLGRLTISTDAAGVVTTTRYDDAAHKVSTTLANGATTTRVYNGNGEVVSTQVSDSAGKALSGERRYYDVANRLRVVEDALGGRRWYFYDAAGRKVGEVDGQGSVTAFYYGRDGKLNHSVRHATGVDTSGWSLPDGSPDVARLGKLADSGVTAGDNDQHEWWLYDKAGLLSRHIDNGGNVIDYRYDGAGRKIAAIHYAGAVDVVALRPIAADKDEVRLAQIAVGASTHDRISRYVYDKSGTLTAEVSAAGVVTRYRHDAGGNLIEEIRHATPLSQNIVLIDRHWVEEQGLKSLVSSDNDQHVYHYYDAAGRRVGTVDAGGYVNETRYDAAGNKTAEIRYATQVQKPSATLSATRPATSPADIQTSYTYDANNRLIEKTDPNGTLTQYRYDTTGNLIDTRQAMGTDEMRGTTKRYDAAGRVVAELDGEGAARLQAATTPADIEKVWQERATQYRYDLAGNRVAAVDAQGQTTLYYYDGAARLTHVVNALGEVTASQYNGLGQLSESVQYSARIDTAGLVGGRVDGTLTTRLQAALNPALDRRVRYNYDAAGRRQATTDALGYRIVQNYDAFGAVVSISQERGSQQPAQLTRYRYDKAGNKVETINDPAGDQFVTLDEFDAFGRVLQHTDANGNTTRYRYDKLGQVITRTDALDGVTRYSYDAQGRSLSVTDQLGHVTTYRYDDKNRQIIQTLPGNIQTTTQKNRFGQTIALVDASGNRTEHHYDRNGKLTSIVNPLKQKQEKAYDAVGQLVLETDASGRKIRYEYDVAGRVVRQVVDPDGLKLTSRYEYDAFGAKVVTIDADGRRTLTEYDQKGQVCRLVKDPAGVAQSLRYEYDGAGKRIRLIEGAKDLVAKTIEYRYDKQGRLQSEIVDPAGLKLTTQYQYDAVGNVTQKTDPTGATLRYVYDAAGRQTYTINPLGVVTENRYDATGNLIATHIYDAVDGLSDTAKFKTVKIDNQVDTNAIRPSLTVTQTGGNPALMRDTRFIEGDFNGDGRMDLLEIRHEADGKAMGKQWLAGTTGYTEGATIQLGQWHADTQYLLGDVSGDGKSDLVAVRKRQDGKAVATIRLTTADSMGEATELELGTWVAETRYLLGDATGDGKADLWVLSLEASAYKPVQATLWRGDGKTFTAGTTVTSGFHSGPGMQYHLADINGDGRQELTVSRYYTPNSNDYVLVFFASENGTLIAKQDNGHVAGKTRQYLRADIQGDGRDDWVEVYQDAQGIEHLRNAINRGDGNWDWGKDIAVSNKAQSRYLAADLNGDGRTDVVQLWRNEAGQAVATAWLSNGTGYTQGSDSVLGTWRDEAVYRLGDQDGDHRADLVGTWVEADGRQVIASWRSDGVQFVQRGDWRRDTRFIEGDFNGDGRMDLLEVRHEADGKAVGKQWLASVTGYTEGATIQLGEWQADTQYLLGDVSGDGKLDLVAVRRRGDGQAVATIRLATADGMGEATELELGTWVAETRYLLGDATGDGKADLWVLSLEASAYKPVQATLWRG